MLVVFEGIDGSGKNTQIEMLKGALAERRVRFVTKKYPTENAKEIREHMLGTKTLTGEELFVYFLKDIRTGQWELSDQISKGKMVILDRYILSTLAYQGGAVGYDRGKNALGQMGFLEPDLIILLDVDAGYAASRKSAQKTLDTFEKDAAYQDEVRKRYLRMKDENFLTDKWVVVDASKPKEAVFEEVKKAVFELLR
jgi:dTMP kinase